MKIGVLTSGGDAPGMNAALRVIAVLGTAQGHEVLGIRRGYEGLLAGDVVTLTPGAVEGIARAGGTMLGSARSKVFPTPEGQTQAKAKIRELGLEGLVVIGGNGSLTGAHLLGQDRPCRIVGIPASIDNDVGYSMMSIGVDTAVNTIVEACDRISDTARAHRRAFVVEVMGRHCGFLAMRAGIAAEADAILYGEDGEQTLDGLTERLTGVLRRCFGGGSEKKRCLIVKAEGVEVPTKEIVARLQAFLDEEIPGVDCRETVLGHVVRGGNPSALDRLIAQRLGYAAGAALLRGAHDVMVGWDVPDTVGKDTGDRRVRLVPIGEALAETERLLDGTSPVARARLTLLEKVEQLLSM